jgi:enamine deaminase RidA (YjgF/YER057c/UK114 family)
MPQITDTSEYFPPGKCPVRTAFQGLLPHPDFLLEIECVAEVTTSDATP